MGNIINDNSQRSEVNRDEIAIVQDQQVEREALGNFTRTRGMKLWMLDPETLEIEEVTQNIKKQFDAVLEPSSEGINGLRMESKASGDLYIPPGHILFEALNMKSAVDRVAKSLAGKKSLCNLKFNSLKKGFHW